MNKTPQQLIDDPDFELVPAEQLPAATVYRHKATGNLVFVAPNDQGNLEVLDAFVELRDKGGQLVFQKRPRRGIDKAFDNIFGGLASVVILAGDPRLNALLRFAGKGHLIDKIRAKVAGAAGKLDQAGLAELLAELGQVQVLQVYEAVQGALADGQLTPDEWAAIQALARQYKAG